MDITPYQIAYWDGGLLNIAEVRPCCGEDNVVDYGIYINNQLSFNVTRSVDSGKWVISMKNADKDISDDVVQSVGLSIDQHTRE